MQKILVIDDSQAIHSLLRARLHDEPLEIHSALDGERGLTMAVELLPDLVLLDISMPSPDGFEVCRRLKENAATKNIPVLFLTGVSTTEEKIRGLEMGATDYITKPFDPAELKARIRVSLRTKFLIDLLASKAMIDGLTGLWNRSYFDQRLGQGLSQSRRNGQIISCMMIDVDHFKKINDEHGHLAGDAVLRELSRVIGENCRGEDVACRYGGEEFAVICPGVPSGHAGVMAERIRAAIEGVCLTRRGHEIRVTASFGVADNRGGNSVLEMADGAMYRAKQDGRNRVVVRTGDLPAACA